MPTHSRGALRRLATGRGHFVLRYSTSRAVKFGKRELRIGISCACCSFKEGRGFCQIPRSPFAFEIEKAEVVDRLCLAAISRLLEIIRRSARVGRDTAPTKIHFAEGELRVPIASFGGATIPSDRFVQVALGAVAALVGEFDQRLRLSVSHFGSR